MLCSAIPKGVTRIDYFKNVFTCNDENRTAALLYHSHSQAERSVQ